MKVLQIGLSPNLGGIETCIMGYYKELVNKDVQFDFISMYDSLACEDEIKRLGGEIFFLSNVKHNPWKFAKELEEVLANGQYDVVHVNMLSAANIVPLSVAHKMKVRKIIAHSHNSSSPGILRNVLHRINKGKIEKYATDFFACSEVAAQWLFPIEIYNQNKVKIIHNAISVERFLFRTEEQAQVCKELNIQDSWVIGHVGRFEEQKNHTFLLDIFKEVVKREPDTVLLLIGEGDLMKESKEKVQSLHLEDKVRFLGMRSDVDKLWKGIDIFLFPSLFEGLPVVAVEAQAAGVFMVLADTITTEVQVTDNLEFLSLKQTASEWAEALCKLKEYKKLEANNHQIEEAFERAGYTIEAAAKALLTLYNS